MDLAGNTDLTESYENLLVHAQISGICPVYALMHCIILVMLACSYTPLPLNEDSVLLLLHLSETAGFAGRAEPYSLCR